VHLAPADHPDQLVAGLLDLEPLLDHRAVVAGHRDAALVAEEVRRVQQEHVQRVALEPLAAVDQPAEQPDPLIDLNAAGVLDRRTGAHLIGDRADAADPRGDVRRLGVAPPAEEGLEEARRLVDAQLDGLDVAVPDAHVHGALALHARERVGLQRARPRLSAHGPRSPCGRAPHSR
jgi:hypothetical protein